ncbi:AbrB/MazE/SpoVT family DNA-binding domain-containing protein [Loigolactobacillus bifermentans]|jgi:AbrB family looped-hinge helix DNA binding protein|uniref:SpoVT-AbrB domain-containing protein n=1 Tax=Loigolactobacillus bifermentans DSM 20003 TaxID=1423726 RepID=A0A0R1GSV1_9LACO|nr:AbrB/MazE/SpoVT family DNA-binding domain-containing protein [Loigolactobacillus bifermentans]KRK34522.1 hypothetical protein FC07_GL000535 [Loigolactobacillus bifermentans DSM 20003]QGG61297.1 AbrB/MazE/SpoVT family DNA-binding domain-containing protein [Loigolactobacillus bifermentans]
MKPIVAQTTVSHNGQVVLPSLMRKALQIEPGDQVTWALSADGNLLVETTPSAQQWSSLLAAASIPIEKVTLDQQSRYDPQKAPHFHDWMVNG